MWWTYQIFRKTTVKVIMNRRMCLRDIISIYSKVKN